MKKIIHIFGGGTFSHVRAHLALATPAFGQTARILYQQFTDQIEQQGLSESFDVQLHLTAMAGGDHTLITNEDVQQRLDQLIADPSTKVIIMNAALCDFFGTIDAVAASKTAPRLESRQSPPTMQLEATDKLIDRIRKERKDIFAVGFKTTSNTTEGELYAKAMRLLKNNSLNLVFANDIGNRTNFIVAPEETRYAVGVERFDALKMLVQMTLSRMQNTFTRSTVTDGPTVPWNDTRIPDNLRQVVDHCIEQGAYKPVLGKTAGHFAIKLVDGSVITSIRKSNFLHLAQNGMVHIRMQGDNQVLAQGAKPSVGGQSQRIIFKEHEDVSCIVHFHCPPKVDSVFAQNKAVQWPYECGSHQCGKNTSDHLMRFNLPGGYFVKAVYLDGHGPNIVFDTQTPAHLVIDFIHQHFDLQQKTGGLTQELTTLCTVPNNTQDAFISASGF